jgi:hypothetical protein
VFPVHLDVASPPPLHASSLTSLASMLCSIILFCTPRLVPFCQQYVLAPLPARSLLFLVLSCTYVC